MDFDVKTENFEKTRLSIVKLAIWLVYNAFFILYNGYRIAKVSFQWSNLQESDRNERLKKENRREDMKNGLQQDWYRLPYVNNGNCHAKKKVQPIAINSVLRLP